MRGVNTSSPYNDFSQLKKRSTTKLSSLAITSPIGPRLSDPSSISFFLMVSRILSEVIQDAGKATRIYLR